MSRRLQFGALILMVLLIAGCGILPDLSKKKKKESVLPESVTLKNEDSMTTVKGFDYIVSAGEDGKLLQAMKGDTHYIVKFDYKDGIVAETILNTPEEVIWFALSKDEKTLYLMEKSSDQSTFRISSVAYPEGKSKELGNYEGEALNVQYLAPYLYFGNSGTIIRLNLETGQEERLVRDLDDDEEGSFTYSLAPDGKKLAYIRDGEVYFYDIEKGAEKKVTKDKEIPWDIKWSPDSKKLAFYSTPKLQLKGWIDGYAPIAAKLGFYDLENEDLTYIKGAPRIAGFISWSPEGTKLAYGVGEAELFNDALVFEEGLKMVVWDLANGEEKEYGPFNLTGEAVWAGNDRLFWPNGRELFLLKLGEELRKITTTLSQDVPENLSPIGEDTYLVATQGNQENIISLLRNGGLVPVTRGPGMLKYLSHNGSYHMFTRAAADGKEELVIQKVKD